MQQMRLVGAERAPEKREARPGETRAPRRHLPRSGKLAVLIGLIIALLAAAAWWAMRPGPPPRYLTAALSRGDVSRTVTATGTVNPVMTIIVGSYVSGVIQDVYCDYNTRVRKGQLCARIDPRPYQAALEQAKGQLARDSAQLSGARADLARYAVLLPQHLVAQMTYTDQTALVHQLEGSVRLDRALVSTAETNLGYTNITSPVDGTVVARNITVGQTVAASFQTPTLFLIATDLTRMQVDTNVSEGDIGMVKEGDAAEFTVEAFSGRTFRGKVVQVRQAPQVVQNVVTYDAVVGVANPQFLLKPGMTATVDIVTAQRKDVLRVPDQALRFSPGGLNSIKAAAASGAAQSPTQTEAAPAAGPRSRVWVLRQSRPVAVPVRVGLDDGTYSELVGGDLHPGEQVIVGEEVAGSAEKANSFRFLRL